MNNYQNDQKKFETKLDKNELLLFYNKEIIQLQEWATALNNKQCYYSKKVELIAVY